MQALEDAEIYGGLTQALSQVEDFHPPAVVEALFRGVVARSGEVAVHFAAMLLFIHRQATSPFDWNQRPFCLEFDTDRRSERVAQFRRLCEWVGADANQYLDAKGTRRSVPGQ